MYALLTDTDAAFETTIVLRGRFDAHEAPQFRDMVDSLVRSGTRTVVVDLQQVQFIDSTALAELVRFRRSQHADGRALLLANPSDAVRVILEITGLSTVFEIR